MGRVKGLWDRITKNPILSWSVALLCVYWLIGLTPGPDEYVRPLNSLMMLIGGGLGAARYTGEAYRVVVHRKRMDSSIQFGYGSHLGLYGLWLVSTGAFYTGVFGLVYVFAGEPKAWDGTAASSFGRFMMWNGFFLVLFSPDVGEKGYRAPKGWWASALMAIVLLAAFLFGVRVGHYQAEGGFDLLPIIEPERPKS